MNDDSVFKVTIGLCVSILLFGAYKTLAFLAIGYVALKIAGEAKKLASGYYERLPLWRS